MEAYFLINTFEEGYHVEEFIYEEVIQEYVTEVLQIPQEFVSSLIYNHQHLEIVLQDISQEQCKEDWFVHLERLRVS